MSSRIRHVTFTHRKDLPNKEVNESINIRTTSALISDSSKKETDFSHMTKVIHFTFIIIFLYTGSPCLCPKFSTKYINLSTASEVITSCSTYHINRVCVRVTLYETRLKTQ